MFISENLRLTEPVPVADVFISGIAQAEDIGGGCLRFTFFSRRHTDAGDENAIVARFVIPIEAVPPAIMFAAKAVGWSVATGAYFATMRLH